MSKARSKARRRQRCAETFLAVWRRCEGFPIVATIARSIVSCLEANHGVVQSVVMTDTILIFKAGFRYPVGIRMSVVSICMYCCAASESLDISRNRNSSRGEPQISVISAIANMMRHWTDPRDLVNPCHACLPTPRSFLRVDHCCLRI